MPVLNIIQKGKYTNALGLIISPIEGVLGGLLLGAITDACANKKLKNTLTNKHLEQMYNYSKQL